MPIVYTYHTQLEAYAHYVPFEPNATRFAAAQLTRTFCNLGRRRRRADAGDRAASCANSASRRASRSFPAASTSSASAPDMRDDRLRRRLGVPADGRLVLVRLAPGARKERRRAFARARRRERSVAGARDRRRRTAARRARAACASSLRIADRVVFLGRRRARTSFPIFTPAPMRSSFRARPRRKVWSRPKRWPPERSSSRPTRNPIARCWAMPRGSSRRPRGAFARALREIPRRPTPPPLAARSRRQAASRRFARSSQIEAL